jgi:hypothetical protein
MGTESSDIHLYCNEGYDESEVWCNPGEPHVCGLGADGRPVGPARAPSVATCLRCLSAAASYGEAAVVRLRELQAAERGD